jgi:hypothetical protein
MKKLLVFGAVVSFVLSSTGFAEVPKGLGLHAGLNFAEVSSGGMQSQSFTGILLGATYDYPLNENFVLVPGAQLIQRGFSYNNGVTDIDYKMTYLEFPLMFQIRFTGMQPTVAAANEPVAATPTSTPAKRTSSIKPNGKKSVLADEVKTPNEVTSTPELKVTPFFTVGPVLGMKLGSSCSSADGTCHLIRDDSRFAHAGFELGIGAIFPNSQGGAVVAQLRYHVGFTSIGPSPDKTSHRGVILQAGYVF